MDEDTNVCVSVKLMLWPDNCSVPTSEPFLIISKNHPLSPEGTILHTGILYWTSEGEIVEEVVDAVEVGLDLGLEWDTGADGNSKWELLVCDDVEEEGEEEGVGKDEEEGDGGWAPTIEVVLVRPDIKQRREEQKTNKQHTKEETDNENWFK